MPDTLVFNLSAEQAEQAEQAKQGIERFDLSSGLLVPNHFLAGFLRADFRIPSAVD